MKQFTNRLLAIIGCAMMIALLSGCQSSRVGLHYTLQKDVVPVAGAEHVPVKISVIDARLVGPIGIIDEADQYGATFSYVNATNDIVEVLKNSIEDELLHRGFKLADNGLTLLVGLNTIWGNDGGRGKITISVQIVRSDGTIDYSRLITGKGHSNPIVHLDGGKIVKLALDGALQTCLNQLFADPSFIDALLKTPGNAPPHLGMTGI